MEIEDTGDENIWGVIGDALEWSYQTEVPIILVILLLVERVIREWIASRTKRRMAADHSHD